MNEVDFLASNINSRYGFVKRARGNFLYTAKGERLTDMYRENGRAILGWGGSSAFTMFKNILSRGITGSYVTEHMHRLEIAVGELLDSKRKIYVFSQKSQALEAALSIAPQDCSTYRPWLPPKDGWASVNAVIIDAPLPWTAGTYILAVKDTEEMELKLVTADRDFPTCRIAPPVAAAIARSIYDLIKKIQELSEKDFFLYDRFLTAYWERRGPYLYPRENAVPKDSYGDFVCHCLDCGIVVSPVYEIPSIVPFGVDAGVFSKLVKNPFTGADR